MKNNSVKILSVDAKDLFISNNYIDNNNQGYSIRLKDGSINTNKFINTLDYSIDIIHLREVYEKVYRNTYFTFCQNNHEYTKSVINVTFKYSNKEFNKISKNTYVKFGYDNNKLIFNDCVCIQNNELIGIVTEEYVECQISNEILGEYFEYVNGKYVEVKTPKTINQASELREILYKNGFNCDGIHYVRFKRSSGSSRQGKCLFIDEKLYPRIHKWGMCGIKVKNNQDVDLAALEAYIALTLSSIIDTIEINTNNILVVDDYESVFDEDVIETKLKNNWLSTKPNKVTIKNSIWDGQSLMDISLFDKYKNKGMLLLRNQFFKSCCFNANIQKWFEDNGITNISQLNGFTTAKDIKDIKLITTPSSIKYLKFGSIEQWLKNISPLFGVVKYEKETHFFDGRLVQCHYQLLNTLQLNQNEIDEFLQPSLDYLKLLKTDPCVLRYYIKYPEDEEFRLTALNSKNDIIYKLLGLNNDFSKTKLYNDFKNDLTKAYVKNMRCGHVLVNGNYSTMLGNPIEMLLQSIGKFDGNSQIGIGNIHSVRFEYDKILLGSRSPHVTIGNIWLPKNTKNETIDKYINTTNEIVCINSIGESVLDRLSGCDFDSDTVMLTDNKILISSASRNYDIFKVPVNHVDSIKRKRKYNTEEQSDLDIKTSNNKIGEIINLSQELNSLLWERMNKGETYEQIKNLYYDICQLDVMSNIEIDKAKKEFVVDTYSEMKKIKDKWIKKDEKNRIIKPNFFAHLARQKGYYDSKKKNYKFYNTSMDYLQRTINRFQSSRKEKITKHKFLRFSEFIDSSRCDLSHKIYYEQVNRVMKLISQSNEKISAIYANENLDSKSKHIFADEIRQECVEYIGKLKFSKSTMVYLLKLVEDKRYIALRSRIINTLFGYPNTSFFQVIKENKEKLEVLTEDINGDIDIFGFKFSKLFVQNIQKTQKNLV